MWCIFSVFSVHPKLAKDEFVLLLIFFSGTFFSKIIVQKSKYCLEMSKARKTLNISGVAVPVV